MSGEGPYDHQQPVANTSGYGAYKQTQQAHEDIRVTEARALLSCAAKLEEIKNPGIAYVDYAAVLRHNQTLWTMFQAGLVDEENLLPPHLKDLLKGLSIYVDRRTFRALGNQDGALLNILITINKEIAAGLMESCKKSATQQTPAKPPEDAPRLNPQIL